MDLREQGDRLLGPADAPLRAAGDHAHRLAICVTRSAAPASARRREPARQRLDRRGASGVDGNRATDETGLASHGRVAAGVDANALVNVFDVGLRAQFGAGWNGGFLADMTLALGGGIHLGDEGYACATIGAGFDGAGRELVYTFHAPVQILGEIDLGAHVRLRAWESQSWVTAAARRRGSTLVSPAFDEFAAGLGVASAIACTTASRRRAPATSSASSCARRCARRSSAASSRSSSAGAALSSSATSLRSQGAHLRTAG